MKKIITLQRLIIIIFIVLCSLFVSRCHSEVTYPIRQLDPNNPNIAKEIQEILLKDTPKIIVIGTGLCENCKIVEETVQTFHKSHPDLPIAWLVYNQYLDRGTFQYFEVTISPTTFFIDKANFIQTKLIGAFDRDKYEETLKSVHFID